MKRFRKNALSIIFSLILVNTGVAHLLAKQIAINVEVKSNQVLDVVVVAPNEDTIDTASGKDSFNDKPITTIYIVSKGDTISQIAEKFNITTNTVRWANNLTSTSNIRVGDKLKILPVSGLEYTVSKGDTISGIANKFKVTQSEILEFNNIESTDKIKPGLEIIIPDGVPVVAPKPVKSEIKKVIPPQKTNLNNVSITKKVEEVSIQKEEVKNNSNNLEEVKIETKKSDDEYFINPMPNGFLSQGLHDKTAIDLAGPVGSKILAAASGTVTLAKDNNTWNGGYGYYIVINHDNGTKTLYAHLSRIDVNVGDIVEQGSQIGLSGRTGRVTGPHLHFEVHGAPNPFAKK